MKIPYILFVCILIIAPCISMAGNNDTVTYVYSCGDDVGIYMKNAGWVVARSSEIGEKRVDRILTIALSLLATGNPSGYFNQGELLDNWCGITTAKPINVLGIRAGQ